VNTLSTLFSHYTASVRYRPILSICVCVFLSAKAALACLQVAAAVVVIAASDKRSRAERAVDVLRALRRDRRPPPGAGST